MRSSRRGSQVIKDRRLEAELFRNCNEFFLERATIRLTFSDLSLSPGGHDLKLLFLPLGADEGEAEGQLRRLEAKLLPELRHYLARRVSIRHLPKISFGLDKGALNEVKIDRILGEVKRVEGEES